MAGTRAQSCDRYGSGTLHPGQVLGGSLPLLSPALDVPTFAARCLYVRDDARDPSSERWNCGREKCPVILPKFRLPLKFMDLLHVANLRHGTDVFTSPPKEGLMRIFRPKNPTASAGFEPVNLDTTGQHATPIPPKPHYQLMLTKCSFHCHPSIIYYGNNFIRSSLLYIHFFRNATRA